VSSRRHEPPFPWLSVLNRLTITRRRPGASRVILQPFCCNPVEDSNPCTRWHVHGRNEQTSPRRTGIGFARRLLVRRGTTHHDPAGDARSATSPWLPSAHETARHSTSWRARTPLELTSQLRIDNGLWTFNPEVLGSSPRRPTPPDPVSLVKSTDFKIACGRLLHQCDRERETPGSAARSRRAGTSPTSRPHSNASTWR